jgi:glycosyltransferase involved in cell wall biosynthesis
MGRPLVSVVVPTYNRADLVERAVDSVLGQSLDDLELIVVDDASEDDTPDRIGAYDDDRIEYVRHDQNRHVSAARNTGIERASGEYVAFLDDDDEWLPEKLERQVELFESRADRVGMVYCWMDYHDGETVIESYRPALRGDVFAETLGGQPIGNCSTLLVRSTVLDDVGGFDESLPRGNDGDFIRRVAAEHEIDYVPEVLVRYHVGHESDRITAADRTGIENAIRGQRAKLEKFGPELRRHPDQRAAVLSALGWRYGQLGDWRQSGAHFVRALRADPGEREIYLNVARTVYHHLYRRPFGPR